MAPSSRFWGVNGVFRDPVPIPLLFRRHGTKLSHALFIAPNRMFYEGPMTDDKAKTIGKRLATPSVSVATMLIIAAAVSACGAAAIGPVDHECHSNPARSQGSGCGNP
jgi:hypothetical protein